MPKSRNRKGHTQKVKARNVKIAQDKIKAKKEMDSLIEEIKKKQQETAASADQVTQEVNDMGLENIIENLDQNTIDEVASEVVEDLGINEII
jgi:formate dehydrogenase maturation protein FdhE